MMRRTFFRGYSSAALSVSAIPEYASYLHHAGATSASSSSLTHPTTKSMYVLARVQAPELPKDADRTRKPLKLSLALDCSGSMGGNRLDQAKEAIQFVIRQCSAEDSVGLVTFNQEATEVFPMMAMDASGKSKALNALSSIRASGLTALSDGVFSALRQHQATTDESTSACVRSTMAFTDGEANRGITEQDALCKAIVPKLQDTQQSCVLHTFGFGSGHNADMLRAIAETGDGTYSFIDTLESMGESFADCLGGLMSTVAQNVELRVLAPPGFNVEEVLTSYKVVKQELAAGPKHFITARDGYNMSDATPPGDGLLPCKPTHAVKLRDFYSSESRDVLVKLRAPEEVPVTSSQTLPLVHFGVEYDNLLAKTTDDTQAAGGTNTKHYVRAEDARVRIVKNVADLEAQTPDDRVREQKLRLGVARAITEATELARHDVDSARRSVVEALQELFPSLEGSDIDADSDKEKVEKLSQFERELLGDLKMCRDGLVNQYEYERMGRNMMNFKGQMHRNQRWSHTEAQFASVAACESAYDTPAKKEFRLMSKNQK